MDEFHGVPENFSEETQETLFLFCVTHFTASWCTHLSEMVVRNVPCCVFDRWLKRRPFRGDVRTSAFLCDFIAFPESAAEMQCFCTDICIGHIANAILEGLLVWAELWARSKVFNYDQVSCTYLLSHFGKIEKSSVFADCCVKVWWMRLVNYLSRFQHQGKDTDSPLVDFFFGVRKKLLSSSQVVKEHIKWGASRYVDQDAQSDTSSRMNLSLSLNLALSSSTHTPHWEDREKERERAIQTIFARLENKTLALFLFFILFFYFLTAWTVCVFHSALLTDLPFLTFAWKSRFVKRKSWN